MIKETRKSKECPTCGKCEIAAKFDHYCDHCNKKISRKKGPLECTVFYENDPDLGRVKDLHYCCWEHLFAGLRSIRCDNFVALPYIQYDYESGEAKEFFKALEGMKEGT